jgi:glycosyltransferase involved in cell wall biosynthesis
MVEVGGQGGVFQHTVALAQLLASLGTGVRVHTADDYERLVEGLGVCTCFDWLRSANRARSVRIALRFATRTVPHLLLRSGRVVWVQGTFKPYLTLLLLLALRATGRTTVFSPHNLFSRTSSRLDAWCITRCVRTAGHVVVYNRSDYKSLRQEHPRVWLLPLVQVAPPISEAARERWRARVCTGTPTVSAIGQIREDKNIPLLLEAAARSGVRVVVMGPDAGALRAAEQRAQEVDADVLFLPGYHDLEDLGAVITLTGVVVCPYAVASQSGVARLAASYGATVVGADVGGLGEQADVLIHELTPPAVAAAIETALRMPRSERDDTQAPLWSESEKVQVRELMTALGVSSAREAASDRFRSGLG